MYCSYHPINSALVQCASCARPLCAACDHRVKGYPYCQDCIVVGVESLSRNHYTRHHSKRRARLAALFAVLPGMGAVYNRQNIKAVAHFIAIVGLFQMTAIHALEGLFGLAGTAFYLYSIIDAYRTARAITNGESAAADEERFKHMLARRAPLLGVVLLVSGLLLFIQIVQPFSISLSLARLMPVALVILGGYLLTRYFKRSREEAFRPSDERRIPYSLIQGSFGERVKSASEYRDHR